MDDGFDFERVLESIRGFVSPEIYNFCSGDMNSDLITNVDDPTDNFDDPCTSSSLNALDAHVDALLLARRQQFEELPTEPEPKRLKVDSTKKGKRIFAKPKTEKEVAQAKLTAIPAKTLTDTNYCFGVWKEWTQHRLATLSESIPPIEQMEPSVLSDFVQLHL